MEQYCPAIVAPTRLQSAMSRACPDRASGVLKQLDSFLVPFYQIIQPHIHFTNVLGQLVEPATDVPQVIEDETLEFGHNVG
jgi:hypothetical protein